MRSENKRSPVLYSFLSTGMVPKRTRRTTTLMDDIMTGTLSPSPSSNFYITSHTAPSVQEPSLTSNPRSSIYYQHPLPSFHRHQTPPIPSPKSASTFPSLLLLLLPTLKIHPPMRLTLRIKPSPTCRTPTPTAHILVDGKHVPALPAQDRLLGALRTRPRG